jgi:hypothetical protein
MRRDLFLLAVLSLSFTASRAALADPVVINGGFEADGAVSQSDYLSNPSSAITGWTGGGNLTFSGVESTTGPDTDEDANVQPHSGTYSAVLGPVTIHQGVPNGLGLGTLSQTITDNPGDVDSLNFFLASQCFSGPSCNPSGPDVTDNFFSASIAGTSFSVTNLTETGSGLDGTYLPFSLQFTATGSDTILFSFLNNDDYFSLDDVSVSVVTPADPPDTLTPSARTLADPSAVVAPEPSSLILLGTGMLGLGVVAKRGLPVTM